MTANQINYATLLEKQRSDRATEELRGQELEESKRATNLMRDTNLRQIEANILNTETSAAASRYGANQAAGATIYSANTQRDINERKIQADVELKSSQAYLNVATANTQKVNTAVNFADKLFGGIVRVAKLVF